MAWDFGAQIHTLTGFDGDSTDVSEEGAETYRDLATQWLTDAAKEVINILPVKLKMECSTITNLYIGNTDTVMDLDSSGAVFNVTRENADSGYFMPCREISPIYAGLVSDSSSMHHATATDPVYWIESDSGGDPKLHVYPTPTSLQPAKVYHIVFPSVTFSSTDIVNFPDEAEYLVVLRAAITALEYKLNFEEDVSLYTPMIANLRNEYQQGVLALQTGKLYTPKKKDDDDS